MTEQLEEQESKLHGIYEGVGVESEEVHLFGQKERVPDAFKRGSATALSTAMSNLAWLQLQNGFRLNLGRDGVINVHADFRMPTMYRVFYRNRAEKRQITRHAVELSWAFGLAESEARRVTMGNLRLVDKNARWRQDPATEKQIAKLAEFGVYQTSLTKGEASDRLGQLFAEQYSH